MNYELLTIPFAYLLDMIIGDPQWNWHPVRLIGRLIARLERGLNIAQHNRFLSGVCNASLNGGNAASSRLRQRLYCSSRVENIKSLPSLEQYWPPLTDRLRGAVLVILVAGLTMSIVQAGLSLTRLLNPAFYYAYSALLIFFSLSIKSLAVEAKKVYNALRNKNIQQARQALSMIVGRDTDKLDEPQIIRATVETVAESAMDGIVAPLFYAFIGGAVLAWGYKAINTLDSMVGYKNERFLEFGRASAKLDGLVNLIPSKITCFLISVSSLICRRNWFNSAKYASKFLFKGPEINSLSTEAAMAGALGIQLGGTNFYNSIPVSKPFVGDKINELEARHITESVRIVVLSSVIFLFIGLICFWLMGRG